MSQQQTSQSPHSRFIPRQPNHRRRVGRRQTESSRFADGLTDSLADSYTDRFADGLTNDHDGSFAKGLADGLAIGLGYLAVSFAFGLYAVSGGMTPLTAAFMSVTNLTSAGQFAGTSLIFTHAPWLEIGLTTLLINIRYMLMSLSLSQKLRAGTGPLQRLLIGYGVTDEIYAVAIMKPGELGATYMAGLIALPVVGWTLGTLTGALVGQVLPESLVSALGIALFAMFVAIVTPQARHSRPVLSVVVLAALLSLAGSYCPMIREIPSGWRLIASTIIASLAGALIAPIEFSADAGGQRK